MFAFVVAFAGTPAATVFANVVIDWDEIGVKTVQPIWFAAELGLALCSRDGHDAGCPSGRRGSGRVVCDRAELAVKWRQLQVL